MARSRGEIAIAHGAQFLAQRRHGDREAELLEYPLREIDQPPAHDTVDRRDRTALNQPGERRRKRVVQNCLLTRRLPIDKSIRAVCVKAFHPIPNNLRPTPPASAAFARLAPS